MKTIEVTRRSRRLSELLAKAQRESLILRSPTGAEFILAEINDFDREIELQRHNPDLMRFLDRRGRQLATHSAAEIRKRLRLSPS
ncbi:MAG: hypothetical protein C5B50_20850 [Verrucomicrobia bacterium]|nr:MAG: hypothetical protein C5B50_20850 [Verrucomicrobiota bacterium]